MAVVVEPAASGRARCRACGEKISKGALRLGERLPNPFGEGEATYWFHLKCAAFRRPELLVELESEPPSVPEWESLMATAARGVAHYRVARIARGELSPTGRARCRHCKERIERGQWRLALEIWQEARFNPMGFLHVACSLSYFGTDDILDRVHHFTPTLSPQDLAAIEVLLQSQTAM